MGHRLFTALIALLPFLYQYASPIASISLGEFVLLPFMVKYLLDNIREQRRPGTHYGYYSFCAVVILACLLAAMIQPFFSMPQAMTIILRLAYYALLIYVAKDRIECSVAIKVLVVAAVANSVYMLIQYVTHLLTGTMLTTHLSFLPVFGPEADESRMDLETLYRWTYRPSGLFLEPSYAAFFSAPALCFLSAGWCSKKEWQNLLLALCITLGIIVSASSTGLVALAVFWTVFVARSLISRNGKGEVVIAHMGIFLMAAILIGAVLLLSSSVSDLIISRTAGGGSIGQRVFRGMELLMNADTATVLVGTGLNNVDQYVQYYGIRTAFDEGNLGYVSSTIGVLLSSGIVAFAMYLGMFYRMFVGQGNPYTKCLVVFLFIFCIFEATLFSYRFSFILILLQAFSSYGSAERATAEAGCTLRRCLTR